MKKVICTLLIIISALVTAQKVKIKKDQITYDDKPIANIKETYRDHYEISTLSNQKTLEITFKGLSANDKNATAGSSFQWLEILDVASGKKAEIPYEVLITSFNSDRIIVHLLALKYNLFNNSGINTAEFENFYAKNTEKLSEKYEAIIQKEKLDLQQAEVRRKEIMSKYSPRVSQDKNISTSENGRTQIVGKYSATDLPMTSTGHFLTIYDLDNIAVAQLAKVTNFGEYKATIWDGSTYNYFSKNAYNEGDYIFVQDFLVDVMSKGYLLGHDAYQKKNQLHQAKVEKAKENSANVYKKSGYVIDEKGVKTEGVLSIMFQMLDINETGQVLPEFGPDNFGQKVILDYKNEKGNTRTKSFNAQDGVTFCLKNSDNTESCFLGLKTKGDAMKKLQNMDALKFNNAYFYQIIHKNTGIIILQHPVETDKYAIKTTKQEKGIAIDTRGNETLNAAISDYLSDCKSLAADIKKNDFDVKLESGLIQIADEYAQCK